MDNVTNQQVIEQMYSNYAAGNMSAVMASLDKDIVWERDGEPFIPFSGTFTGIDAVMKMFAIQATSISIKEFVPDKICVNEDTVSVLGHDVADVISTNKTYATKWVQAFTLSASKITHVQVYMDTKAVADAFLP
jgi:ketosteroid isomerase-like protein